MMSEHSPLSGLIYPLINFAILVAGLVYFLRKPLKDFVLDRHATLRDEIERVHAKLREAQKRYAEYSQRLSTMDAEVASLTQQIREEVESSRVRIVTEAKRAADQIVIDSKRTSESMIHEFRDQIRAELANQVILRTEVHLRSRITGEVREQMTKDFSKQVETSR
ncbi:MAG: ATP synthase F0 subunit B [Cryobacterium sp.]|nr:ATP synthase F0 subunit B [Oligoflexia bacterium]